MADILGFLLVFLPRYDICMGNKNFVFLDNGQNMKKCLHTVRARQAIIADGSSITFFWVAVCAKCGKLMSEIKKEKN